VAVYFKMPRRRIKSKTSIRIPLIWIILLACIVVSVFLVIQWKSFFASHSMLVPGEGGVFTESIIGEIENLNPLASEISSFDQDLHELLFSGLLRYNPVTAKIEDSLAEFRIDEDGDVYELILKESAKFSDGRKVVMDDILFTFEEVIQNPHFSNNVLGKAFEYVTIEVVDERTVRFVLPEENVFFLSLLTTPILPKDYFRDALLDEVTDSGHPYNRKPIGTGPYRINNIVAGGEGKYRIFLERNPYFHGERPLIPELVFYLYPSLDALKAEPKENTILSKIPENHKQEILDVLDTTYKRKLYLLPRYIGLFFNLDRPYTKYPSMRKALSYAIDKEKLVSKEPGWERIDSPFFFEGIETSFQVKDFVEGRNLLRDGGFPYNKEKGLRTKERGGDVVVLRMITTTAPASYSRMAQNMVNTIEEELQLEVDLHILEMDEFQAALESRDYDLVLYGNDFSENFDSLSAWHSSQSGKLNLSNLTREDVDFLIDEIRFSGAQSDFFLLSQKLDELVPAVILATPQYSLLYDEQLKGLQDEFGKIRKYSDRFSNINSWYFFEKEDWDIRQGRLKAFVKWIFMKQPNEEAITE